MKNTRSTKEVVVIFFFWMMLVTIVVTVGLKVVGLDFSQKNVASERSSTSNPEESLKAKVAGFQDTLKGDPDNLQALTGLGDAYLDSKHFEQAIEVFLRAEKIAPANVHIENDLGLLYLNTSDYEQAIEKFQKVLDIDSTHLISMYYIGVAHHYNGDTDKALQVYKQLLALNPTPEIAKTVKEEIAKIKPDVSFK